MSRIGKKPVAVPGNVTATIDGQSVSVKGPKGELSFVVNDEVLVKMTDDGIVLIHVTKPKMRAPSGACPAR